MLSEKPSGFPDSSAETMPAENALPWYAVRTKSNFEQIASHHLASKGLGVFLPTYREKRRWSDRVKEIQAPLFTGYVFCQLNARDPLPVLTTPGVVDIVSFGRELAVVDDAELAAVRAVLKASLGAKPWPFLESGQKIVMRDGPLRGVEGVVLETRTGPKLVVSVTLLKRSISVEVERGWVAPIS